MHILLLLWTYMFTIMLFLSTGGRWISITLRSLFLHITQLRSAAIEKSSFAIYHCTTHHILFWYKCGIWSLYDVCGGGGGTEEQAVCMLMSLPDLSYCLPKLSIWVWTCTALQILSEWQWLSIWGIPTSVKVVIFQHERADSCHNGDEEWGRCHCVADV